MFSCTGAEKTAGLLCGNTAKRMQGGSIREGRSEMFCLQCGNTIQPGMVFCTKCGNPVKQQVSVGGRQSVIGNETEMAKSASGQADAAQKSGTEAMTAASMTAAPMTADPAAAQTPAGAATPVTMTQIPMTPAAAAQVFAGSTTASPADTGRTKKRSALPAVMIVASVLAVAAVIVFVVVSRLSYRSVKIEDYDGAVELERDGEEEEIFEGLKLKADDRVTTGADGVAELLIDSDKHLVASENTSFSIQASGSKDSGKVTIRLEYGTTLAEIENKLNEDSEFEIVTPNATCSVRGTVYKVSYYPDLGMTRIDVTKGTVRVKTASDKLDLNAGESAIVADETIYPIDPSLDEDELIEYLEGLGVLDGAEADEGETGSYSVVVLGANEVGFLEGSEVSLYAEDQEEALYQLETDDLGRCFFDGIDAGTYDMLVSADGYNDRRMQIEVTGEPGGSVVPLAPEIINDDCCILLEWDGDQDLELCVYNEALGEYINTAHPVDSAAGGFLYADHGNSEKYELFYLHDMSHEIRKSIYVLDGEAAQAGEASTMEADGVKISVYSIDGLCYLETAAASQSAALWNPCYIYAGEVLPSDQEYIEDLSNQTWTSLEEEDQFTVSTDWASAYLAQLEAGEWEWGVERIGAATVLYLDEDDIPEIVICISENIQAGGPYDCVYSYKNGEIYDYRSSLDGIDYVPGSNKIRVLTAWGDPRVIYTLMDSGFAEGGGNDGSWERIRYDMTRQELVDYLTNAAGGGSAASGEEDGGSSSEGGDLTLTGEWGATKSTLDTLGFILRGDGTAQMISNGKYVWEATYTYDGSTLTLTGGGETWILEKDGNDFTYTGGTLWSDDVGLKFKKV